MPAPEPEPEPVPVPVPDDDVTVAPARQVDLDAKLDSLPKAPGCYLFKDKAGEVVYVGKAKTLRSRVKQLLPGVGERRALLHPDPAAHRPRPRDRRHRHRERGRGPRERAHQAAPAALQREAPRRQGLPLSAARHDEGVAAPRDGAQARPRRRALLRPVPLGHERAAHAAPREQALPAPHVHRSGARLAPPALPPVPDQALPRAVRDGGRRGLVRRAGPERRALPRGPPRRAHGRARATA